MSTHSCKPKPDKHARSTRPSSPKPVDWTTLVHPHKPKLVDDYATTTPSGKPRLSISSYENMWGDWQARRVRRFYQRYFTGVGIGGHLRVLTLTTSDKALALGQDIHRSFRALVLRLRRRYGRFEYIGVKEVKNDREHLHWSSVVSTCSKHRSRKCGKRYMLVRW